MMMRGMDESEDVDANARMSRSAFLSAASSSAFRSLFVTALVVGFVIYSVVVFKKKVEATQA